MAGRGVGPDFVEALARGLSVLSCFDARHPRMTLTEIADASGLARPTARRLRWPNWATSGRRADRSR
jgi:IclR family pca regulon transcriptional regulator